MGKRVRRDTALGQLRLVPLGNVSLGVWISMTSRVWRLSSHKGQCHFTTAASDAAALWLSRTTTACLGRRRKRTRI
jgi:hypothetical protein